MDKLSPDILARAMGNPAIMQALMAGDVEEARRLLLLDSLLHPPSQTKLRQSKAELLRAHKETLAYEIPKLSPESGEEQALFTTTAGARDERSVRKQLSELKPILEREMTPEMVHEGRYLLCRTLVEAFVMTGCTTVCEDLDGSALRFAV